MADVTTGLYMISAICGLVDAVCFLALGAVLIQFGIGWLLLLMMSLVFSLTMIPLLLGDHQSK